MFDDETMRQLSEMLDEKFEVNNAKLKTELKAELNAELKTELGEELSAKLKTELGEELSAKLKTELGEELSAKLKMELSGELNATLKKELGGVREELQELKRDVSVLKTDVTVLKDGMVRVEDGIRNLRIDNIRLERKVDEYYNHVLEAYAKGKEQHAANLAAIPELIRQVELLNENLCPRLLNYRRRFAS